jgi:hypothetical protein
VWVRRPDFEALEDNLIERALDRERQRDNEAVQRQIREGCPPDKVKTKHDSPAWYRLSESLRGR